MNQLNGTQKAGICCMISGALLAIGGVVFDRAHVGEPTLDTTVVRVAQTLFVASVPGLMSGVHGLSAAYPLRSMRVAAISQILAQSGLVTTAIGSVLHLARPTLPSWLNPLGSVLQSSGMLVFGIAVLRGDTPTGWRRCVPLLLGGWFMAHMPVQLAFFMRPHSIPSHTLMMGVWGPLWAVLGYVLSTAGTKPIRAELVG